VDIFPEEDALEFGQRHARMDGGILVDLAVMGEFLIPGGLGQGAGPLIGFHSVIDRPDSVSRVIPPTTTINTTRAATTSSQRAMCNGRALDEKPIFMSSVLAASSGRLAIFAP
jgi:hypothetical protein